MLTLTKLASSGLAGLGATGLGVYFTPSLLSEITDSSNVIYFSNISELSDNALSKLTNKNREMLDKLTKLSSEYQAALTALIASIKAEHSTITSVFSKLQESEDKLRGFYEKNKKHLEQLREFLKTYYSTSEKKLQIEQLLHQTKYWNNSLLSIGNVISGWGLSLEKFLCAINDSKGEKNCDTVVKNWLSDSVSTTSSSSIQLQGGALKHQQVHSRVYRKRQKKLSWKKKS